MKTKKAKHLKTVLLILGVLVGLGAVGAAIAVPVKLLTGTTTSAPSESTVMCKYLLSFRYYYKEATMDSEVSITAASNSP